MWADFRAPEVVYITYGCMCNMGTWDLPGIYAYVIRICIAVYTTHIRMYVRRLYSKLRPFLYYPYVRVHTVRTYLCICM